MVVDQLEGECLRGAHEFTHQAAEAKRLLPLDFTERGKCGPRIVLVIGKGGFELRGFQFADNPVSGLVILADGFNHF